MLQKDVCDDDDHALVTKRPALPTTQPDPQGDGDTVTVTATDKPGVVEIASIQGDGGRLSLDPEKNCVGIAARETLALLGNCSCGVSLTLNKVAAVVLQRGNDTGGHT